MTRIIITDQLTVSAITEAVFAADTQLEPSPLHLTFGVLDVQGAAEIIAADLENVQSYCVNPQTFAYLKDRLGIPGKNSPTTYRIGDDDIVIATSPLPDTTPFLLIRKQEVTRQYTTTELKAFLAGQAV